MSSASSPSHHHFYGWYAYHPGLSSGSCILAGPANPIRIAVPDDLLTFAWRCWVPNEILSLWILRIMSCVYIYIHTYTGYIVIQRYTQPRFNFGQVYRLSAHRVFSAGSWFSSHCSFSTSQLVDYDSSQQYNHGQYYPT